LISSYPPARVPKASCARHCRILANEKDNHKFNFLLQNDPYHAYYQQQLEQYRSKERGEEEPKSEDGDGNHAGQQQQQQAESEKQEPPSQTDAERKERERRDMQQRALRRDATGAARALEPPDEAVYSVDIPEDMAALDLDVIKLTAQFVARNGKQFLTELTSREHANPQFAFLKPTHSLFSLFTSLADAYSKVLMPPRGAIERVKRDAEDKEQLLERCLNRLEWEQAQEREQREEEAKAQRERDALARIDWHDFVVADKIEFGDDDDEQLPDPLPKRDVIAQVEGEATETAEAAASVSVAPGFTDEEAPYEEQELDERNGS
jgi:splicing factor 3A subunit 1